MGTASCRSALDRPRKLGFAGMQLNAVVETNHAAWLHRRLGFGIVPGACAHPTQGRVGLHGMSRTL